VPACALSCETYATKIKEAPVIVKTASSTTIPRKEQRKRPYLARATATEELTLVTNSVPLNPPFLWMQCGNVATFKTEEEKG